MQNLKLNFLSKNLSKETKKSFFANKWLCLLYFSFFGLFAIAFFSFLLLFFQNEATTNLTLSNKKQTLNSSYKSEELKSQEIKKSTKSFSAVALSRVNTIVPKEKELKIINKKLKKSEKKLDRFIIKSNFLNKWLKNLFK